MSSKRTLLSLLVVGALLACFSVASAQPAPAPAAARKAPANKNTTASLDDAYKREFAFLEAEKRALQARLAEHEAGAKQRSAQARAEIAGLQGQVVSAAGEVERLEELVLAAEREVEVAEASEGVTEDILLRAEAALKKAGRTLPDADVKERTELLKQLSFIFESAPKVLVDQARVRIESGSYFDGAGKKLEGSILRVGNIASYGLVPGAMGPLAPAGENHLKLWPSEEGASIAGRLAQGATPSSLPLFIYESLETGVTPKADKSVLEVIRTGGLIAWVIVALGLVALAMVLLRAALLLRASRGGKELMQEVIRELDRGSRANAIKAAKRANSPTGRILVATLENLECSRGELEDIVAEAVLQEQPNLSRFGSSILVLAAVSPLLGLLGTVTGMISTFDVITEFGTGNPKLLSGGISEALVTTELGLVVAIPALLLGHVLSGFSDGIRDNLDASALAAVNRSKGLKTPGNDDQDLPIKERKAA